MFKLIKYELKGYYRDFLIAFGIIVFLNLLLLTRIHSWQDSNIHALSSFISMIAVIGTFFWNLYLFTRDLYQDSGYLLFTLPKSGRSILGAKLLTSLIQIAAVSLVASCINFAVNLILGNVFGDLFHALHILNPGFILLMVVGCITLYIFFLSIIYLSITISRVTIKKRFLGKFGSFIVFVLMLFLVGKVTTWIPCPDSLTVSIHVLSQTTAPSLSVYNSNIVQLPIPILIVNLLILVGVFLLNSYLLENKLDL